MHARRPSRGRREMTMIRDGNKRARGLRATRARLVLPGPTWGRPSVAFQRVSSVQASSE